jgi:hypothetical protein
VGNYLVAVIGTPILVWVVCLGCGLALERLLRVRLSNALLPPLGLCVAFVLIMPGYTAGAGDALAIALLAAATVAGFALAKGGLRARLNPGWAGVAALAVYVIYTLPVIAYGHWTWSGYDFVNDSAFEMLLANHLKGFGTLLGQLPESSQRQFLVQYLGNGYPLGTQALLGTFSGLIDTSVAVIYQPYISSLAALAAMALVSIGERRLGGWRAALVGVVAVCANLTYQYALQGGIKEIGLLATIRMPARLSWRSPVPPRWRHTTRWRSRMWERSCCFSAWVSLSPGGAGLAPAGPCRRSPAVAWRRCSRSRR